MGIALAALFIVACAGHAGAGTDGGAGAETLALARGVADGGTPLGDRATTLALAQSVEAMAVREGAGARSVELHTLAASVLERVWRIEGREQDAREAIDLFRAGASDLGVPGGCDAALRAALLTGELAHDAGATYAELYRVQRRAAAAQASGQGKGTCPRTVEERLTLLAAFRPPARALEAIDQGLAREGALAAAVASGGVNASRTNPHVVGIESWPGPDATRVVIILDRAAPFGAADEVVPRGQAPRTYVDLYGVDPPASGGDSPMSGIVTRLVTTGSSTGTRVSMQLDGLAFRRVFHLAEPFRVVIDIARHPPGASRGRRPVTRIVLDPGHGGNDPGAIGSAGVKEKEVTLDIARRVATILKKQNLEILLTRDDDHYVTLEERTARANAFSADLFVSIHCNAAENRSRHGVETYVLDTTKDEIAARVAARENATSTAANVELGSILANMRLADQASRSTRLAELFERAAIASLHDKYPDVLDGGVHTAGFYVLVGARMPSVLFETSYISNAGDEQRLASDDYKERLADAIVNAIKAYREGR